MSSAPLPPVDSPVGDLLPWDSEFFGRRIARLRGGRLTPALLEEAQAWCRREQVDCLYFLADADDATTANLATASQFAFVDVRVTLAAKVMAGANTSGSQLVTLRDAQAGDLPRLREIARVSHHDSRFYFDSNFAAERCDALYETWIEKSVHGYADFVVVAAGQNGAVMGYITGKKTGAEMGEIGLLAVASDAQGLGLGPLLVQSSFGWFQRLGIAQVRVVTQGRNVRAQRCYQRCGFVTDQVQIWYHRWF